MNIRQMLMELLGKGPMTRDQLCEAFGYEKYQIQYAQNYMRGQTLVHYHRDIEQYHSRTTLYDNLKILKDQGKVEKFSKGREKGKIGRLPIFWRLIT